MPRFLIAAVLGLGWLRGLAADGEPADALSARVVILANADDPESRELAGRYAELRGVPADNIVALPLPAGETISWREYAEQLHNPLQAELLRRGWLDGTAMDVPPATIRPPRALPRK